MDTSNLSKKEPSGDHGRRLQTCVEILTRWFAKWSACFPNHPVSKLQTATYAEALGDLTAEQLEYGCRRASEDMEQFPKPGHIRKHGEALNFNRIYSGPAMEWDPQLERERLDRKAEWERLLASGEVKPAEEPEKKPRLLVRRTLGKTIEQQKQELKEKGWIK